MFMFLKDFLTVTNVDDSKNEVTFPIV